MKNSILTCLVLLFTSFAIAQSVSEKEVPAIVKSTFLISYPDQTTVNWEKEKGNYEANFKVGKTQRAMLLDSDGNILETEEEIDAKNYLPKLWLIFSKTTKTKKLQMLQE